MIAAESTVALAGAVIGDLLAQGSDRTLPRPRQIMAIFVFYGILSLVAGFGRGPARFAAAAGGVAALALLVIGGAGNTIDGFLQRVTRLIQTPSPVPGSPPPVPTGAFNLFGGTGQREAQVATGQTSEGTVPPSIYVVPGRGRAA